MAAVALRDRASLSGIQQQEAAVREQRPELFDFDVRKLAQNEVLFRVLDRGRAGGCLVEAAGLPDRSGEQSTALRLLLLQFESPYSLQRFRLREFAIG